jgi:hypothetical protein
MVSVLWKTLLEYSNRYFDSFLSSLIYVFLIRCHNVLCNPSQHSFKPKPWWDGKLDEIHLPQRSWWHSGRLGGWAPRDEPWRCQQHCSNGGRWMLFKEANKNFHSFIIFCFLSYGYKASIFFYNLLNLVAALDIKFLIFFNFSILS